jgi:hypothetical protein
MNGEYATITLDKYHEFIKLEEELKQTKNNLNDLEKMIEDCYEIKVFSSPAADPLNPRPSAIIRINRRKLAAILKLQIEHSDVNVKILVD